MGRACDVLISLLILIVFAQLLPKQAEAAEASDLPRPKAFQFHPEDHVEDVGHQQSE